MIHKLFLIIALSYAGVSYAQYSSSPFSTQGIGEAGGLEDAQFGGIGNCRTAVMDSATVNFFNPSSYTTLAKGQPLFSIGVSSRFSNYTQGDLRSTGRVAGLNQIAMVIPAGKRIGFAVGLLPFSRKGYSILQNEYDSVNGDTYRYTYVGSGSTQQVFGGLGAKVLDYKRHEVSIGANYGFVFGSVTNQRRSELIGNDPAGGNEMETYRLHGGQYSIGLNYAVKFDEKGNHQLRLGGIFTPQQQLSAHRESYLFYATDVSDQSTYSVLDSTVDNKGSITYPASTSFGFNYTFRPATGIDYKLKSVYQLSVYGDYTSTLWSNYASNFEGDHDETSYQDAHRIALGVQFTPNFNSYDKTVGKTYLNRIRYRAGGYFGTLPNVESGVQLSEYGVTLGLGLPIASQKTNSSFNFSFQYGTRGNGAPEGIQEQFLSVNFGVILAPAKYDTWFKKFKLD